MNAEQNSPKFTTPAAPHRMMKRARHVGTGPSPVLDAEESKANRDHLSETNDHALYPPSISPSSRTSPDTRTILEKGRAGKGESDLKSGRPLKQSSKRRPVTIQSGAAAHDQRSRTQRIVIVESNHFSNTSTGPPLPVPDRPSSRRRFRLRTDYSARNIYCRGDRQARKHSRRPRPLG